MHFTVLVVGTQFGWEEVYELLLPYWDHIQQDEENHPNFVFQPVNIEEEFEKMKSEYPNDEELHQYKTVQEWAENYLFSYQDGLGWGRWKNPQQKGYKWDWFQIGGRWRGFFLVKKGTEGLLSKPVFGSEICTDLQAADQVRKGDIDWEAMRERARQRAKETWDFAMKQADPYRKKWGYGLYPTDSKKSFIERQVKLAGTPFAILINGNWIERGWEPYMPSEKSMIEWHEGVQLLLEKVSDDAVLTLVDCHT